MTVLMGYRHTRIERCCVRCFAAVLVACLLSLQLAVSAAAGPGSGVVMDADAQLAGQRATVWQEAGAEYILLTGEVRFQMGAYAFRADRAVVRIQTDLIDDAEASGERPVRRLAVYMDEARPMAGADATAVSAHAQRLLVTGATVGRVHLDVDRLDRETDRPGDELVAAAHDRLARHEAALAAGAEPTDAAMLMAQADAGPPTNEADDEVVPPSRDTVLPVTGSVQFSADRVVFDREADEDLLMLVGNVRLFYEDEQRIRRVQLQAERAVVFLQTERAAAPAADAMFEAGAVSGIYLEDNIVITDGEFTLRAPRIFYDLARDQAVVLDAVLYTWDVDRRIPLYMRAESVRQTSRTSFEARRALLTTSEFAVPHVAIGANRITLDMERDPAGVMRQRFSASHTTLQVAEVPIVYWPYVAGETRDLPLRRVGLGRSRARGVEVETSWDLLALAGIESPDGLDVVGQLDYRGRSGPGVGGEVAYDLEGARGRLEGYLLPMDSGQDRVGERIYIDRDDETRGFVRMQHRQVLPDNWSADVELAYVSDPLFLEAFFPREAYDAKPYQSSLYLRKQESEWAADLWVSGQLNNFTPQMTTLQAPGFQVERQPEMGYFRTGTSLFDDRLTWYSENRFSRVRARFGRDTPADRGFREQTALEIFGIDPDTRFVDAADDAGFARDWRLRVDTRQEITMPLAVGPMSVTPYAVGRVTAYDEGFEAFAGEDDQIRLWGSLGLRLSTQWQRSYDAIHFPVFNINRLRHLIEPSVDLFLIGSTINAGDLPPFDSDIEGIADGSGVRLGLRQTLQTQRGGPGRWRSVDWITLQTDMVFRSSDGRGNHPRNPLARFYEYRPEYALGGDHFYSQVLWMVSDTLGVTGEWVYDFQDNRVSQWRTGASLQHTPRLSSFIHYRDIRPLDSQLLSYGFTYQLTSKYTFSFSHRLDLRENESRNIDLWLERRLPRARLRLVASFDQVDDEQVFGVVFSPEGFATGNPFGLGGGAW